MYTCISQLIKMCLLHQQGENIIENNNLCFLYFPTGYVEVDFILSVDADSDSVCLCCSKIVGWLLIANKV